MIERGVKGLGNGIRKRSTFTRLARRIRLALDRRSCRNYIGDGNNRYCSVYIHLVLITVTKYILKNSQKSK